MSQLHLVLVLIQVSSQFHPTPSPTLTDLDDALGFLAAFADKPRRGGLEPAAHLVLTMHMALLRVRKAGVLLASQPSSSSSASGSSSSSSSGSGSSAASPLTPPPPQPWPRPCWMA